MDAVIWILAVVTVGCWSGIWYYLGKLATYKQLARLRRGREDDQEKGPVVQ